MSIRRKSTTHDLATLRLHPDGSRVQQSSVNAKHRTAGSTVVDSRGNWIAKDAGGKSSVKKRRGVSVHTDNAEGEFIQLSSDDENGKHARSACKGKQRARDSEPPDEDISPELERLNPRTRRRLSFTRDLSFLDPPPVTVPSFERSTNYSGAAPERDSPEVSFPHPAPELLKSIHHFASCYYRERGQLFDSSRNYRGKRKERREQSKENIHTLAANAPKHQNVDSEGDWTEMEDETTEEDETESDEIDSEDSGSEGPRTDSCGKDMYKAFDGSALMAIGIVLQEYVAHTLSSRPHASEEPRSSKRRRTTSGSPNS